MKIDGVFSGGGVKAYAFIGALQALQQKQFQFERVAGTSAGAILASFIAAGYTVEEIMEMLDELDLEELLDPPTITKYIPMSKWLLFYFQLGLYKGERFEQWVRNHLARKNVHTFGDIKEGSLKVIVSDLSMGKLIVIPDDLKKIYGIQPNQFSVAKAVRMSAGFPYFFTPVKLKGDQKQKSIMVDGGLLSNFPIWVFDEANTTRKRPIVGMKLSDAYDKIPPRKISNALDMLHGLFATMKQAHDTRYVSKKDALNIIFIPVKDVDTTDFSINEKKKRILIDSGRERAEAFLKQWP